MLICPSCALKGLLVELLTANTRHFDGTIWFSTACHACSTINHYPPQ